MINISANRVIANTDNPESYIILSSILPGIPISTKEVVTFSKHYIHQASIDGKPVKVVRQHPNDDIVVIAHKTKKATINNIAGRYSLISANLWGPIEWDSRYPDVFFIRYIIANGQRRQLEVRMINNMVIWSAYPDIHPGDIITTIDGNKVDKWGRVNIKKFYEKYDPKLDDHLVHVTKLMLGQTCRVTVLRDDISLTHDVEGATSWYAYWTTTKIKFGGLHLTNRVLNDESVDYLANGIKESFFVYKVDDESLIHLIGATVAAVSDDMSNINELLLHMPSYFAVENNYYIYKA